MHVLISSLSRFTQPTGICRYAANLARSLSDFPQLTKITLMVGCWQQDYFQSDFGIDLSRVEIVPVSIENKSFTRNRWFLFGLPRAATACKADLVHLGFPMPILRSQFQCPVVATVHDLYPFDMRQGFGHFDGLCKRMIITQCLNACHALTCVSESTYRSLRRRRFRALDKIPVGLVHNYAEFSHTTCHLPGGADRRPFLLTVAQHQPNKRLDLLLRSFAQLRKEKLVSNDLRLLVVGSEGPQSNMLLELTRSLDLGDLVGWLPRLSDQQLGWAYQNCEAFIVSSCIEGFCLPLLEALQFNCRTVASNIPVFHEIAGDAPAYFDTEHDPVRGLTAAIHRALGAARPVQYVSRFSRENTANECLALYSKLFPALAARNTIVAGTVS